jgi:hypothetical protein
VVRTQEGEERARATVQRQAERDQATWEKRLWHLGNQTFACQPDAEAALAKTCQRLPPWLTVASTVTSHPTYSTRGRPRKDASASALQVWQIQASCQGRRQNDPMVTIRFDPPLVGVSCVTPWVKFRRHKAGGVERRRKSDPPAAGYPSFASLAAMLPVPGSLTGAGAEVDSGRRRSFMR